MNIEKKINYHLNKYPFIKRLIKRVYQRFMCLISMKPKSEGDIIRISPNDQNYDYFFGYYDKSPWDITDRYMLCMKASKTWDDPSPRETADILLIDTFLSESDPNRVKKISETKTWNVQQGSMLQWMGPDYSSKIIFNDYRNNKYVSVILDIEKGSEKIISMPIYTVSNDGKTGLSLDFSRLYNLRPGYGYFNEQEKTKGIALPDATAIWRIDLETGDITDLLSYKDFAHFLPRKEMLEHGTVHKVNHLMLSPNGERFMVLYRWFNGHKKYTRLITCDIDGSNKYLLSDDDMVSHCFWKDNETILAFENKKEYGPGYYLMVDKTQKFTRLWKELDNDGHPSYSPNRKLVVTDTYPNRNRISEIKVMKDDDKYSKINVIARVYNPFRYDNDTRCDLHPRWNREGDEICFDSTFEGRRRMYIVKVDKHHFEQ